MFNLKEYKKTVLINDIPVNVDIKIQVDEDDFPIAGDDFDFGNEADNKDYLKKFENGELMSTFITVEAHAEGEMGRDSLGAVHVSLNNLDNDVLTTIEDHDINSNWRFNSGYWRKSKKT